jgi:hypothetical protein
MGSTQPTATSGVRSEEKRGTKKLASVGNSSPHNLQGYSERWRSTFHPSALIFLPARKLFFRLPLAWAISVTAEGSFSGITFM